MKKFNPGRLKERIKILKRVESINELSQRTQKYEVIRSTYAEVIDTKGNKYYDAKKIEPEITHFVYTRYSSIEIEPDMLIEHKGKKYEVKSCIDMNNEHVQFEVQCTEKVKKSNERF